MQHLAVDRQPDTGAWQHFPNGLLLAKKVSQELFEFIAIDGVADALARYSASWRASTGLAAG
jgi:LPS sulfotransferase NodH